jgi:hypothetical protein
MHRNKTRSVVMNNTKDTSSSGWPKIETSPSRVKEFHNNNLTITLQASFGWLVSRWKVERQQEDDIQNGLCPTQGSALQLVTRLSAEQTPLLHYKFPSVVCPKVFVDSFPSPGGFSDSDCLICMFQPCRLASTPAISILCTPPCVQTQAWMVCRSDFDLLFHLLGCDILSVGSLASPLLCIAYGG